MTPLADYSRKEKTNRFFLIILILPVMVAAVLAAYHIFDLSHHRKLLKKDFSEVNNIQYGLLSVDNWRDNITDIVTEQIDNFEFSKPQTDSLKLEINKILNALIDQAERQINEKQKSVGGKIKKFAIKTFFDIDNFRERVPEYSATIIKEIEKPRSKENLKFLAKDKLKDFAEETHDSIVERSELNRILSEYHATNLQDFNTKISKQTDAIQDETYNYTFFLLGIMVLFLLIWRLLRNRTVMYIPLFTFSIILALIVLTVGLSSPMIEIDARIKQISFVLVGKPIQFFDQVIFYQSKSILDVVSILIMTKKPDSMLVGVLLLIFSVLFPITKLISTKIYLLGRDKWKENKVVQFFAFKSGKWSMADVMVVAIFMAYIGFKGILDTQLGNADLSGEHVAGIATNKTSLQPGFILFIGFVLFSLVLSVILKRITKIYSGKKTKV